MNLLASVEPVCLLVLCVHVCGHTLTMAHICGGQRTACGNLLSCHLVRPRDGAEITRLASQCLYPLSNFAGRIYFFIRVSLCSAG